MQPRKSRRRRVLIETKQAARADEKFAEAGSGVDLFSGAHESLDGQACERRQVCSDLLSSVDRSKLTVRAFVSCLDVGQLGHQITDSERRFVMQALRKLQVSSSSCAKRNQHRTIATLAGSRRRS